MIKQNEPRRGNRWSVIACIALSSSAAWADEPQKPEAAPEKQWEPMVVSALRVPREASTVTSAVTVLDPDIMVGEGILTLRDALNASPGVISTSTAGQAGAIGSLFIRGTRSIDSQVVVDGMRFSDSNSPMGNFLASGRTFTLGRVELLRGPQGAMYGGDSTGGVLWMETPRGCGPHSGSLMVEGGSFDSLATYGRFQGSEGSFSYHLSGGYEETQNDGPAMDFDQSSTALRVENIVNDIWTVGGTFRMVDSYYNNMGASDDYFDAVLGTVYAQAKVSEDWTAWFRAGYMQDSYDSDSAFGNFGTDAESFSISTDHEIVLTDDLRLLTGAFFHETDFSNTIGVDDSRSRFGGHAVLEWDSHESLTHHAALRWEDYDEFGDEWTWRLGSLWRAGDTGFALRGSAGTSFRPPSFLDLYGSSFGAGNPALDPESGLGWDFGFTQKLGENHDLEVTWFRNLITDSILANPTPPVNLAGTQATDGVEMGLRGLWDDPRVGYRLAWTYLHESLSDQPRNAVTGSVDWKPVEKLQLGAGATHFSSHSWGGDELGGYVVARLFGSYQITDSLKFHARVENVLDEEYELSSYTFGAVTSVTPGAGTGVYCGLTFEW
jgi:vitamin B12 transporter